MLRRTVLQFRRTGNLVRVLLLLILLPIFLWPFAPSSSQQKKGETTHGSRGLYNGTIESLREHKIPQWFHDAKIGLFFHYGIYTIPAYAPLSSSPHDGFAKDPFANFPFAEWYYNTMRIPNSQTAKFHKETYGDKSYWDFVADFERETKHFDASNWAELLTQSGAKYGVLTSKHHDGFTLWSSKHRNSQAPRDRPLNSKRNFVTEFTEALRERALRVGIYYSGGIDWSWDDEVIRTEIKPGVNLDKGYAAYADSHLEEIIDMASPDILWNDISYPKVGTRLLDIIARYYNTVPDGVINDRFRIESGYETQEYTVLTDAQQRKWETCRGLGTSFAFNRLESEKTTLSGQQIVKMLVDVVSKNGNILLGVCPMANGSIPSYQVKPLLDLGEWLRVYGEAIYHTRPWIVASTTWKSNEEKQTRVFATQNPRTDSLYLFLEPSADTDRTFSLFHGSTSEALDAYLRKRKTREETFVPESIRMISSNSKSSERFSWSFSEDTEMISLSIPKEETQAAAESPFVVLKIEPVPKKELSTVSISQM